MTTEVKIEKGRALVLAGPKGCGKTRLARKMAAAAGSYIQLDAMDLQSKHHFLLALEQEPTTCIVKGLPRDKQTLTRLKVLLANTETVVHRKHQEPKRVRSPKFIFCTSDLKPLKQLNDRRFHVVFVGDTP